MSRSIDITVTLDDADNEVLEVSAGLLNRTPDDLLGELVAPAVQRTLKQLIRELRDQLKVMNPISRAATRAVAIAREKVK